MVQYYQIDKTSGLGPNRIALKMIKNYLLLLRQTLEWDKLLPLEPSGLELG